MAVLGRGQGHGTQRGEQVQQLGNPFGLLLLHHQLAVGGLGLVAESAQAVEHDQAHGVPGLAQPPR